MFKSLFSSTGEMSSKRLSSFFCLIVAVVLAVLKVEAEIVIAFLSAGLLFQGISALSERG